jgi:hypothetical protein
MCINRSTGYCSQQHGRRNMHGLRACIHALLAMWCLTVPVPSQIPSRLTRTSSALGPPSPAAALSTCSPEAACLLKPAAGTPHTAYTKPFVRAAHPLAALYRAAGKPTHWVDSCKSALTCWPVTRHSPPVMTSSWSSIRPPSSRRISPATNSRAPLQQGQLQFSGCWEFF